MSEAIDQALHFALGVAIALPVASFAPFWACAMTGLIASLAREDAQHRRGRNGIDWPIRGSGGRWIDIAVTTAGALCVGFWGDFA